MRNKWLTILDSGPSRGILGQKVRERLPTPVHEQLLIGFDS